MTFDEVMSALVLLLVLVALYTAMARAGRRGRSAPKVRRDHSRDGGWVVFFWF